eukprot:m.593596 g.593596  ORF g.593596 m.593596 type:complete len:95 (-) comp22393_c0_seq30:212-496(-)
MGRLYIFRSARFWPQKASFAAMIMLLVRWNRYLGGDLNINSAEGYGTDAYVHLPGNAYDATEVLPAATKHELSYTARLNRRQRRHWLDGPAQDM